MVFCAGLATMTGMEPFATIARNALESMGWSQSELARRCGISTSAMSRYLSGERTPSLLDAAQISRVLGISLDKLSGLPSDVVNQEEREILRVVRTVGTQESLRRLVQAPVYAVPVPPANHGRGAG
jgi:transcriptional regulator with XRE-family HTH domain